TDHEHREALLEKEANKAVLRLQVENVKLVDPGRNEQQWGRIGLIGERRILDEFDETIAVDNVTFCEGEVLTGSKRFGVRHAQPTRAQTEKKRPHPISHAAAAGLECFAESRWVGWQKQGRASRVDQLSNVEHESEPLGRFENVPAGFLEKLVRNGEIALLQQPKERVLLPSGSIEASVGYGPQRFILTWRRHSPPTRCGADPRLRRLMPQPQT